MTLNIPTEPLPLRVDADGVVRVGGTRVPLDTVIFAFSEGASPEEIVAHYPSVCLADVYTVVGFYLRHQDEVDAYLEQRRQQAERIRREIEARFPSKELRERLVARRAAQKRSAAESGLLEAAIIESATTQDSDLLDEYDFSQGVRRKYANRYAISTDAVPEREGTAMNDRIVIDPDIQHGKPVIRGTRVPVVRVVGGLAGGMSFEDVMREYDVAEDDVRAALAFAAELIETETFRPLPTPSI